MKPLKHILFRGQAIKSSREYDMKPFSLVFLVIENKINIMLIMQILQLVYVHLAPDLVYLHLCQY